MRADELQGREFDWFAVDKHGRLAMFSTAGEGPMPAAVLRSIVQHDAVSEAIETPNVGSELVWRDFGRAGLFVYDWAYDRYVRVAEPSGEPSPRLLEMLRRIDSVPSLDCAFEETSELMPAFGADT